MYIIKNIYYYRRFEHIEKRVAKLTKYTDKGSINYRKSERKYSFLQIYKLMRKGKGVLNERKRIQ